MEHTKGKLVATGVGLTSLELKQRIATCYIPEKVNDIQLDKANAERLTVCWNEHDTLKAKAELLEKALGKITKHAYKGIVAQTAYEALAKAKEL